MRLVLLGPAGAGKGTQARLLSEQLAVPHISTGNILRHEIEAGTELGQRAKELIDKGNLVSDDVANAIVQGRLLQPDVKKGYILDGYPRTLPQAEAFDEYKNEHGMPLTAVIDLEVDEAEIVRRLSGRRECSGCGATFHLTTIPPLVDGKCDFCGSPLLHREDDTPEAIRRRLQIYRMSTQPLIDYYRDRRMLIRIDAQNGVERTFDAICHRLGLNGASTEAQ